MRAVIGLAAVPACALAVLAAGRVAAAWSAAGSATGNLSAEYAAEEAVREAGGDGIARGPRGIRQESGPRLAVTIDDLPWNGAGYYTEEEILERTRRLLEALRSRDIVATGFVTCGNVRPGAPGLRLWLDAGMELGNHSTSHPDLNATPVPQWLEDVRRCGEVLHELVGTAPRHFRFPMLHEGATRAVRDSASRTLHRWGYRKGHVTVDNSEWILARPYDRAVVAGDSAARVAIGDAYVAHVLQAARHFRDYARRKFGRDVDHVLLLHANALASDHLAALLDALSADGFRFASLGVVLQDPVYALPDDYVGRRGLSWLYRAAPFGPEHPWDDVAEAELRARFGNGEG